MHIVYFCSLKWERIAWFWVRSSICRKKNKSCTTWGEGYGGSICTISDEDLLKDAHASEQRDDDNTENMNSKENHHCSQVKQFGIICLLGCCPHRGQICKHKEGSAKDLPARNKNLVLSVHTVCVFVLYLCCEKKGQKKQNSRGYTSPLGIERERRGSERKEKAVEHFL